MNFQSNISSSIYKIRKAQRKVSDMGIGKKKKKAINKICEDIHKTFSSAVSEITEIPQSVKKELVCSLFFLLRSSPPLNINFVCAAKAVLYIVKNASSNFLDLSKTNKQMFVKAVGDVLKSQFPGNYRLFLPLIKFKKSVLLFATYLLTERRKISFHLFLKIWEKLNIYSHIPKYAIIKVLKTSEFIVIDRINSMSLGPSFEPVNCIVESYSKLILQSSLCENWNLYQNEQNAYNCSKALCEAQMLTLQSNQEEKPKSIKKEQDLHYEMRVSKADNIVETTHFKDENNHEASEKTQTTFCKFSFIEYREKLLNYSFFTIRRYFEDALPNYIILSSLLASENVCEYFAILSIEDQFDFLEKCYCSLNIYGNSPSDSNYHKLNKSTLVEERVLIICYLVVKSGGIHYTNLIKLLKNTGICVQICEDNACSAFLQAGKYFKSICPYINFSKKGFLTLKPPFSGIKRSLKNKYVSAFSPNYVPSYACPDNSLCFQIPNENKNVKTEMLPSSSSDFHNQLKDSMFEAEKKVYSDQKVFDAKDVIDVSVFILSICEKMHIEQLSNRLSSSNLKNIKAYSLLNEPEKLTFFKRFPQYFIVDSNSYVSLEKGVANHYEPQSEIDFSNLFINCTSASKK